MAFMPLSESARLIDLEKLRGVVEGSRRSIAESDEALQEQETIEADSNKTIDN